MAVLALSCMVVPSQHHGVDGAAVPMEGGVTSVSGGPRGWTEGQVRAWLEGVARIDADHLGHFDGVSGTELLTLTEADLGEFSGLGRVRVRVLWNELHAPALPRSGMVERPPTPPSAVLQTNLNLPDPMVFDPRLLLAIPLAATYRECGKRNENIMTELEHMRIPALFVEGVKVHANDGYRQRLATTRQTYVKGLNACAEAEAEYCLLFEDDTMFVPGFRSELTKTIDGLPADWEILHLCPQFLWGRMWEPIQEDRFFHLNPMPYDQFCIDKQFPNLPNDTRHFPEWPRRIHDRPHFDQRDQFDKSESCPDRGWPGGPVAFVVAKTRVERLIGTFEQPQAPGGYGADDTFARQDPTHDFLAREPQLCHERKWHGNYSSSIMR